MSVKEHYNTIDEMLHEKIVIYLKIFLDIIKELFQKMNLKKS